MAEGCEKVSHVLNPARPLLAPCVRHAQQAQTQELCEDVQMFLDRDLSVQRGKMDKRRKNNPKRKWAITSFSTELLISNYTTWHTENTIGFHWVSGKGKQNLSLCWAQARCRHTKSQRAATDSCPHAVCRSSYCSRVPVALGPQLLMRAVAQPSATAAIPLPASPLPALSGLGTTDVHAPL